jgi:hypothetical protein
MAAVGLIDMLWIVFGFIDKRAWEPIRVAEVTDAGSDVAGYLDTVEHGRGARPVRGSWTFHERRLIPMGIRVTQVAQGGGLLRASLCWRWLMHSRAHRVFRAVLAGSLVAGAALTASVVGAAQPASTGSAVTLYVATTGTDRDNFCNVMSRPCSTIQHAINRAMNPHKNGDNVTIDVAPGTYDENMRRNSDAEPISASSLASLTITGAGASTTTVSAQNASSVFTIDNGVVTISGLTLTKGDTPDNGGGVDNVAGTVTLTDDSIVDNSAGGSSSRYAGGGGVFNGGTMTLTGDTLFNNIAGPGGAGFDGFGGGLLNAGGISTSTVTNDTLFDNFAGLAGSGIANLAGTVALTDDTFSDSNISSDIFNNVRMSAANSVFDNTSSCSGYSITDNGYNVEADDSCGFGATSKVDSSTINLASNLAPNGSTGPETLAIGPNSSAYEEVPTTACTVMIDERGDPRPGVPGQKCDAGAYEYQASATSSASPASPSGKGPSASRTRPR